jgi:flagellar biogenesis protein FliO
VLLRGGFFGVSWGAAKTARKLHIEESRVVGNRQHLVVAEYEGKRVLIGISPGRIDFLCGLEGDQAGQGVAFAEALSDATSAAFSPTKTEGRDVGTKEVQ